MRKQSGSSNAALRYATNQLLVRVAAKSSKTQKMVFRDGTVLNYRRNLGDLQSIREIWLERHYRLPVWLKQRKTLVDLGGNIGMTTLWLAKEYGFSEIVVVEPDATNASLLRTNLDTNGVGAKVFNAAIGPKDGEINFASSNCSNRGRISSEGVTVPMVSMPTVTEYFRGDAIDLVKLDIEGGEEFLVSSNCGWMDSINCVITELHPEVIDVRKVISAFADRELVYHPGNAGVRKNELGNFMDMFVRAGVFDTT